MLKTDFFYPFREGPSPFFPAGLYREPLFLL